MRCEDDAVNAPEDTRGQEDRKRSIESMETTTEDSLEYVGLLKRPKTPLITAE